jgi:hypothetical protein
MECFIVGKGLNLEERDVLNLRAKVIRLAYEKKNLRPLLLPLLVNAASGFLKTEYGRFGDYPLGEVFKSRKDNLWTGVIHWPGGRAERAFFEEDGYWKTYMPSKVRSAEQAARFWVMNYRPGNPNMGFGRGFERENLPGPHSRKAASM